jgi:hypothetical protein
MFKIERMRITDAGRHAISRLNADCRPVHQKERAAAAGVG